MKAIDIKTTANYVCKRERDLKQEEQTVFEIKFPNLKQETFIEDELGHIKKGSGNFGVALGTQEALALHTEFHYF